MISLVIFVIVVLALLVGYLALRGGKGKRKTSGPIKGAIKKELAKKISEKLSAKKEPKKSMSDTEN